MKASSIEVGGTYLTKIGKETKPVVVVRVSDERYVNTSGRVSTIYLVRTPAGNQIYRHNSQLKPS